MRKKIFLTSLFCAILATNLCACGIMAKTNTLPTDPAAFEPFKLEPYIFAENESNMPEKANPVNLEETTIFWNGNEITNDKLYRKNPDFKSILAEKSKWSGAQSYNSPYAGNAEKNWPPCDGFGIVIPKNSIPEDESGVPVGKPIRLIWTNYFSSSGGGINYLTFACNEKKIKTISLTGLPDNTLVELDQSGITLQFQETGEYTVLYEVTDTDNVTRTFPAKYTFKVF